MNTSKSKYIPLTENAVKMAMGKICNPSPADFDSWLAWEERQDEFKKLEKEIELKVNIKLAKAS